MTFPASLCTLGRAAIACLVLGALPWATGAYAGPVDRMLRACAPGVGADPAATLIDEGWLELGVEHLPLIAARLGLLEDVSVALNYREALDDAGIDPAKRVERGERIFARNAESGATTYLTPRDGRTMAQITLSKEPVAQVYCMISTVADPEAAFLAKRLTGLTTRSNIEGIGGLTQIKNQSPPPTDPTTDVAATPLPQVWDVKLIDLTLNSDLADADFFLQAFYMGAP